MRPSFCARYAPPSPTACHAFGAEAPATGGHVANRRALCRAGGGEELASQLDVPLLGRVPLVPTLREGGDTGHPVAVDASTEVGKVFEELARVVDEDLKPTKRSHPELNLLG